jgi:iron complex outermembrane receptor protein
VIVVSAERRDQDLQKIPESVSSFSGSDLLDQGITDFNTLQYNVPSLFSGGGLTRITLRGVGSEIVGPGVDPGFAVHVNNVFSSRETTGLLDYFDIERVDVLRGPQGTLWGRNSTGGALNILTNKPVHNFDTNGDLEMAWFEGGARSVRARGMLNTPLVEDKLALRVAGLMHFNDGIMLLRSPELHQRVSDAGNGTLRACLR